MKRTLGLVTVLLLAASACADDLFLKQSRGVNHPINIDEWRKKENRAGWKPYLNAPAGTPNPTDGLWHYGGSGWTSFSDGLGDMRVSAWTGLLTKPFHPSFGLYLGIPTGDSAPSAPPAASPGSDLVARSLPTGDGEWDVEPRLAAGYGFGGVRRWPVRQYVQAEAGFWFRTRGIEDAITWKLERGTQFPFRFVDRFWLIWRFVGVESFASNEQAARDATGLGDGVTYVAGCADVYGRIWKGLGCSIGVDYALRGRAVPDAVQVRTAVSWQY